MAGAGKGTPLKPLDSIGDALANDRRFRGLTLAAHHESGGPAVENHRRARNLNWHAKYGVSCRDNVEFVPKHDDFQVLKIARPDAQRKELKNPPKHQEQSERNTKPPA